MSEKEEEIRKDLFNSHTKKKKTDTTLKKPFLSNVS